jgi:ribosome-associated translation inhibitor RaiA
MADVASELFSIIRYAFLKSRFGLGTYLSTRIRHGVFEGEMRSFLERLDLILSTDSGNYVFNSHWPPEYHLDRNSCEVLNCALSQFSRDTDRLITTFKDGVIQIRVDNNDPNEGLFFYDQPTEIISQRFLQYEAETDNAQDFCHKVIEWLWEITEQCLEAVRERVRTELKPRFTNNIQQLEINLGQIQSHTTFQSDMHTAINKAREELTARITKVENWFHRQEAKPEDFRLSDHIKMAFDTIQKYSPDVNVVPDWKMPQNEPLFRAQFSASMFDLLTIFFSNVFRYSCEEFNRPMLLDVLIEDDNLMHLHLENKLRPGTDEAELNNNFQERINDEKMLQREKGSGLAKAMNIIRYDFGDQSNTYTIVAAEGKCIIDVYIHLSNMIVETA